MPSESTLKTNKAKACPTDDDAGLRFILLAAHMLLENNTRSAILKRHIDDLAEYLGIDAQITVAYRSCTLHLSDGRSFHLQTKEYRINVAASLGILRTIALVLAGTLGPVEGLAQLRSLERAAPCHSQWELALLFGLAAAALAWILRADYGAIAISGVASSAGLLARQSLGKRHWPLFVLPFAAAAIGGAIGGLATRWGWTQTSGLCIVVPALMLVPGPHLINGLYDVFENYIHTGICRLVLAGGILISAALGILLGTGLVGLQKESGDTFEAVPAGLLLEMILAGVAACGFGSFFNAPWRVKWISVACGMLGYCLRYLCLAEGASLSTSTLIACLAIGLFANIAAIRWRLPFSGVAFAGAVPLMPGMLIYRSMAGALELALTGPIAQPAQATAILSQLLNSSLIVGAMAVGLLVGAFAATTAAKATSSSRGREHRN